MLIAKASLHAFAEGHALLGNVSACRMATYYYRGVGLPRRTDEFAEDASLRVSFRWKTHAVEGKVLEEFWLESVVNFRPRPAVVPVVCKNLCNRSRGAHELQGEGRVRGRAHERRPEELARHEELPALADRHRVRSEAGYPRSRVRRWKE